MLSRTYTVEELAEIMQAKAIGKQDGGVIEQITTDSRGKNIGKSSCFFAISGLRNDGHIFINDAYSKGVRCFVVNREVKDENLSNALFLKVNDTLEALQLLAKFHRKQLKYPIVAVTGSNGKTVVKEWLYQIMSSQMLTVRSPKSYNSQLGVPLSILSMPIQADLGILEAGISMPGEMARLAEIIAPDIGIITNVHRAHLENFRDSDHLVLEKLNLFRACKVLIYRQDYKNIQAALKKDKAFSGTQLISWSDKPNSDAEVNVSYVHGKEKSEIHLNWEKEKLSANFPFSDIASVENVVHCIVAARYLKVPESAIKAIVSSLPSVAMRLQQIQGVNNCTIVNDSYNSDLTSLEIALNFLNIQRQHGKKTLILSDIFQSGMKDEELYSRVNKLCIDNAIDRLIGVGASISSKASSFEIPAVFFKTTEEVLDQLNALPFFDEVILIKGSRDFGFERISSRLEFKKHETTLEVNLSAVIENLNSYRSKLKAGVGIMAIVKAYSYGTGSNEIANVLEHHGVNYLAVAYLDEGVALRRRGIKSPIMVMNPSFGELQEMSRFQLEPEVFSLNDLQFLSSFVRHSGKPLTIHLKVESGMHRLGFDLDEVPSIKKILLDNTLLKVATVFTHLAGSDKASLDEFTKKQVRHFNTFCENLERAGIREFKKHALNSDGILRFQDYQFDMVRLGIGLYGITSMDEYRDTFRSVLALKSRISQLKDVKKGESIGYNRNFVAHRDMKSATVAIGYADGFPRILGNGNWHFTVNGQPASILGNVCMDMTMIDVSHISDVREKDEVIILADNSDIYTMAAKRQTIPYEVLTSISERVKRIYYYGD